MRGTVGFSLADDGYCSKSLSAPGSFGEKSLQSDSGLVTVTVIVSDQRSALAFGLHSSQKLKMPYRC